VEPAVRCLHCTGGVDLADLTIDANNKISMFVRDWPSGTGARRMASSFGIEVLLLSLRVCGH